MNYRRTIVLEQCALFTIVVSLENHVGSSLLAMAKMAQLLFGDGLRNLVLNVSSMFGQMQSDVSKTCHRELVMGRSCHEDGTAHGIETCNDIISSKTLFTTTLRAMSLSHGLF